VQGAVVAYPAPTLSGDPSQWVTTMTSGNVSGAMFSIGTTPIRFKAVNNQFQTAACDFNIIVSPSGAMPVQGGAYSCFGRCTRAAANCWCDSSCLDTGDCCADYELYCSTTEPPTPGAVFHSASCAGKCGAVAGTCWCDPTCVVQGDCCDDFQLQCGETPPPTPSGTVSSHASCAAGCAGMGVGEGAPVCWCDAACTATGDCCLDRDAHCGTQISSSTCTGNCGKKVTVGTGTCWCDSGCDQWDDCCADFQAMCGVSNGPETVGSCLGQCGQPQSDCFCDSACEQQGDCCSDWAVACKAGTSPTPWTPTISTGDSGGIIPEGSSCQGNCGKYSGQCFCDSNCRVNGDCCADIDSYC